MLTRLAIALCCAFPCLSAWADDSAGRHVAIVLDASQQMGGALSTATAPGQPRWTRLGAAREAVHELLQSLASDERHTVTLVLMGHRLAAQEKDGETVSVPQQEYLRLAEGKFERLNPAEDVEIVRESRPLTEADLGSYQATLDALKPWGEAPLTLAIERALELSPTQVVVVTSGDVETNRLEHLRETLSAGQTSISIIHLGAGDAAVDDLRQIAQASGGELYQPQSASEVAQTTLAAVNRQEPRRISTLRPQPVTAVFQEPPVVAPAPPAAEELDQVYDIVFEVTYYGAPVKEAEVIIHGDNFDLIYDREAEYNKPSLRANRLAGKYLFKGVPLGSYQMEINANVKNRAYQVIRGFAADDDNKIPGMSFKIQLEKSKDAPPPPPPAGP